MFQGVECRTCIHEPGGCSVMDVHLLWNYDQIVDGSRENNLSWLLTDLIDDTKPLGEMCSMRVQKTD
jgi:hypothetical protein